MSEEGHAGHCCGAGGEGGQVAPGQRASRGARLHGNDEHVTTFGPAGIQQYLEHTVQRTDDGTLNHLIRTNSAGPRPVRHGGVGSRSQERGRHLGAGPLHAGVRQGSATSPVLGVWICLSKDGQVSLPSPTQLDDSEVALEGFSQ